MTSSSKHIYIDKLDAIENNTYHSTIKMKPVHENSNTYIDSTKKLMRKILNSKLVILLECQNVKIFLQKVIFQIGLKKFLWLKKLKILCRGHKLLIVLMKEILLECFTKKNCQRQIKKNF